MNRAGGMIRVATAVSAMATTASAADIDKMLGRWSGPAYDECDYADDSEGAPLKITNDANGTHLGSYGWLCTVKDWKQDGDFLVGLAKDCGQEGGDYTFELKVELSLNDKDELLMGKDASIGLRRCPAVQ